MAFKIFLDANVLLDLLLKRDNYESAKKVFSIIVEGKAKAFVTPSIIHTTGYWLTKQYGSDTAKALLLTLLLDVGIIDTDHEMTTLALQSNISDIEDALQYYAAIHHQIDLFISEDKGFQKAASPTLPVIPAAEFAAMFP